MEDTNANCANCGGTKNEEQKCVNCGNGVSTGASEENTETTGESADGDAGM